MAAAYLVAEYAAGESAGAGPGLVLHQRHGADRALRASVGRQRGVAKRALRASVAAQAQPLPGARLQPAAAGHGGGCQQGHRNAREDRSCQQRYRNAEGNGAVSRGIGTRKRNGTVKGGTGTRRESVETKQQKLCYTSVAGMPAVAQDAQSAGEGTIRTYEHHYDLSRQYKPMDAINFETVQT